MGPMTQTAALDPPRRYPRSARPTGGPSVPHEPGNSALLAPSRGRPATRSRPAGARFIRRARQRRSEEIRWSGVPGVGRTRAAPTDPGGTGLHPSLPVLHDDRGRATENTHARTGSSSAPKPLRPSGVNTPSRGMRIRTQDRPDHACAEPGTSPTGRRRATRVARGRGLQVICSPPVDRPVPPVPRQARPWAVPPSKVLTGRPAA
jgi:hypothetical protein